MLIDNIRTPAPLAPVGDHNVKFNRAWKYSPRGWDIVKIKRGETVALPESVALVAANDRDGHGVPAGVLIDVTVHTDDDGEPIPAAKSPVKATKAK
jgi:hypothetical protein